MTIALRLIIIFLGTFFTVAVIRLLVKKRISERNSLFWLIGAAAVYFLSINPETLDRIAARVGVDYPPTLLFLFSILILLLINLYHSVQISVLSAQVRELTQHIAISNFTTKEYTRNQDISIEEYKEAKEAGCDENV